MSRVDFTGQPNGNDLDGSFVCISDRHLLVSILDETSKAVPRRIPVNGNPTRLAYSQHLGKLIVGLEAIDDSLQELDLKTGKIGRSIRPTLAFIDLDHEPIKTEEDLRNYKVPFGQTGERITSLITWNPTDGKKKYEMIIIATCLEDPDTDACDGRMVFINARPDPTSNNLVEAKVKHAYRHEKRPIYSMASYGPSSLVFCSGKQIILRTFEMQTREWRQVCEQTLPSPGIALSVREPFVHVTTAHHSLMIFKVDEKEKKFVSHAHDRMSRPGLHHVVMSRGPMLAVTSSRGGTVVGLSTISDAASPVLFEANLPLSVSRLREAKLQPVEHSNRGVFYGSTIDGTLYHYTTLNVDEWRLLRFIQIVCRGESKICPFTRRKIRLPPRIEPLSNHPEAMHIDGDMLSRLLELGVQEFKQMISNHELQPAGSTNHEIEDSAEVITQFCNLADIVLGSSSDYVIAAMKWIRQLLQSTR